MNNHDRVAFTGDSSRHEPATASASSRPCADRTPRNFQGVIWTSWPSFMSVNPVPSRSSTTRSLASGSTPWRILPWRSDGPRIGFSSSTRIKDRVAGLLTDGSVFSGCSPKSPWTTSAWSWDWNSAGSRGPPRTGIISWRFAASLGHSWPTRMVYTIQMTPTTVSSWA